MATGSVEEVEEERRLLYVAMTRAREDLHLVLPRRFHVHRQRRHGDRHVLATPSRFLTPEVRQRLERRHGGLAAASAEVDGGAWETEPATAPAEPDPAGHGDDGRRARLGRPARRRPVVDVPARLRDMWSRR